MNQPSNHEQFVPILGKLLDGGEVEYIGSAFIVRWIGEFYLCSAGHTFTLEYYSEFYYSINDELVPINMEEVKLDSTNVDLGREGSDRIGRKDDYAFLKVDIKLEGLVLDNEELEYGQELTYKGFTPSKEGDIASGADYVEMSGTHYSDGNYDYSDVSNGAGNVIRMKMYNTRKALIEDCVQGNSGGPILIKNTNRVVGLLTNGRDGNLVYITSDYIMDKLVEFFNIQDKE